MGDLLKAGVRQFELPPCGTGHNIRSLRYLTEKLNLDHVKVTGPYGDIIGDNAGANTAEQAAPGANIGSPQFNFHRKFSDSELIGNCPPNSNWTKTASTYASWARGYIGQAIDADLFISQAGFLASPVAQEKSRSFEQGFKARFGDRAVSLNANVYDTKFIGYQTTSSGTDGAGAPVLRSAGSLNTSVFEADINVRPIKGLSLSANMLYADNKFGVLFINSTNNLKGGVPLIALELKFGLAGTYDFRLDACGATIASNYTWTDKTLLTIVADANNSHSIWLRLACCALRRWWVVL
jgi:iron complex outermembrane recepter protein